jgi:hypothetical protein
LLDAIAMVWSSSDEPHLLFPSILAQMTESSQYLQVLYQPPPVHRFHMCLNTVRAKQNLVFELVCLDWTSFDELELSPELPIEWLFDSSWEWFEKKMYYLSDSNGDVIVKMQQCVT